MNNITVVEYRINYPHPSDHNFYDDNCYRYNCIMVPLGSELLGAFKTKGESLSIYYKVNLKSPVAPIFVLTIGTGIQLPEIAINCTKYLASIEDGLNFIWHVFIES